MKRLKLGAVALKVFAFVANVSMRGKSELAMELVPYAASCDVAADMTDIFLKICMHSQNACRGNLCKCATLLPLKVAVESSGSGIVDMLRGDDHRCT